MRQCVAMQTAWMAPQSCGDRLRRCPVGAYCGRSEPRACLLKGSRHTGRPHTMWLRAVTFPPAATGAPCVAEFADNLDVPVIELGLAQINRHGAHTCVDLGETAHLPAALEANLTHRGRARARPRGAPAIRLRERLGLTGTKKGCGHYPQRRPREHTAMRGQRRWRPPHRSTRGRRRQELAQSPDSRTR